MHGFLRATRVLICLGVCGWAQQPPQTPSEVQRAIDEFKVQTANLGLRTDSPVQAKQTRSPLRDWHGRLYENFRNDLMDAVPHEIRQNGSQKGLLRRNQFGFNVSGPIFIPRLTYGKGNTYFSLSYEGVRERIARSRLLTIPNEPQRTGDYSHTVDPAGNVLPIYDPETTRPNPAYDPKQPVSQTNLQYLRDPFAGNVIPANRLNPVAVSALQLYPKPNTDIGPFFQNNYFIETPEINSANGMIGKMDHPFGERQHLYVEFAVSDGTLDTAKWFPTAANPGPLDRAFTSSRGSLQHVITASAQTVNTASFEASSTTSHSGQGQTPFPVYEFDPYVGMGRSYPLAANANNSYTWSDALSLHLRKHSLSAAVTYAIYQVNTFWPAYPNGWFQFSSELTSLPGIIDTGDALASFLLGLPQFAEQSFVTSPSYFRRTTASLVLRDHYEPRKGLAVDIGVNIAHYTPRVEKFDRQSTIDLTRINPANDRPGALMAANRDGESRGFRPTLVRVAPSVGIAWSLTRDSKTVLRANYSRSYSSIPIYQGQFGTQGFNNYETFLSPNSQLQAAVPLTAHLPPPAHEPPDLRLDAANNTVADLIDATSRLPTYQSASLTIERELPGSIVLSAGAYYSGGRNLIVGDSAANPNAIPLAALVYGNDLYNLTFNQSLRPYPQFQGFELYDLYPLGRYQRDAGFIRVEKRTSMGLALFAYYEFSKQMDDYSGPHGIQDFFHRQNDWSLTSYNSPKSLQLSYTYDLPIGSNKPFLTYADWRRHLIDGWSLSGTATVYSGTPIALRPEFNNTGGVIPNLAVDVVPGVNPEVANPGPSLWFNPAAFTQPQDFTMGDAARTNPTLRNPLTQNYDLSVSKRFPLGAERAVEFNATGFDFLNHANWNDPDPLIGPPSAPNVNAGKITGSRGGRVIQLTLRFSF
ncbi:MAG TPA: hypothetical protein VMT32_12070 [Bryobacteraceae bacterium]|nr:hypothetical protein [Bryobacteraceae bacterium]